MSLGDITLNSRVYSVSSVDGKTVQRRCSAATLPGGIERSILEISHQEGAGNKPDRHLVKFVDTIKDSTTDALRDYVFYFVVQVPKGGSNTEKYDVLSTEGSTTGAMYDNVKDILTETFTINLINGEFS